MALGKVTFLVEYKPVSVATGLRPGVPCGFSESWVREIAGDPTDTVFNAALRAVADYWTTKRLVPLSQDWVIASVRLSKLTVKTGSTPTTCSFVAKQVGILNCPQERRGLEDRTDDPYASLFVEVGTSSAPRKEQFRGIPDSLWTGGGFSFDTAVRTIKPFFDVVAPSSAGGPYRASKAYFKSTGDTCSAKLGVEGYQGWCLQRYSSRRIGRPFAQLRGRRSKKPEGDPLTDTLNPCGLVMDCIRSCYSVRMQMKEGHTPVLVRWYWCPPGALPMPAGHAFGSRNWENREGPDAWPGEVPGTRTWLPGETPANAQDLRGDERALACANAHTAFWQGGLGASDSTGPYDAQGRPTCCLPTANSECTPPPVFDCLLLADDLTMAVTSISTACATGDQTVTLTRPDPAVCEWLGSIETFAGTSAVTLTYAMGTWAIVIDCFLGNVDGVLTAFTESPLQVEFDVPDTTWCCEPGGGGGLHLVITE